MKTERQYMQPAYQHVQPGTVIRVGLGATAVLMIVLGVSTTPWLFVPTAVLLCLYALFHSLTVEVSESHICIAFGVGIIRRSIPLFRVASCSVVQTPWYFGWGIRFVFKGWMWNVSGPNAVELTYTSGGHFRIGTDEPEALAAAIEESIASQQ